MIACTVSPFAPTRETSSSSGAPSRSPRASTFPRGAFGRPLARTLAVTVPRAEPRTDSAEVTCTTAARLPVGPLRFPDSFSVPASAGDSRARSGRLRSSCAANTGVSERVTLPLNPRDSARPVNESFCSLSSLSVTVADTCSPVLPSRSSPAQIAAPPSIAPVASAVTRVAEPSRASCALMLALPRTFCPAIAASGARSNSRSSSCALC